MMRVNSTVKLNMPRIRELNDAAITALEQTAEALHKEVEQARVMPRDTGTMQNESTFVDTSESSNGKVTLVTSTPYARRLYFHPEYNFHREDWADKHGKKHGSNPNARGKWYEDWLPGGKDADFCAESFKRLYRRIADL